MSERDIMSILKQFGMTDIITPKPLIAFTDGSCIGNGNANAKGGFSVVWPYEQEYNVSITMKSETHGAITNNRAELYGILTAFDIANKIDTSSKKTLTIYSDSKLLVKSMNEWMRKWKQNNWTKSDKTPVLNRDLLEILDKHMSSRSWVIHHVRAHTNKQDFESKWNAVADKLAHDASTQMTLRGFSYT